jgi:putative inorganic carbon (hco3(-)) transporter
LAKKRRPKAPSPRSEARDPGEIVGAAALALVLAGTALVVDAEAAAAFDAPKRLIAMIGIAVAATATFAFPRRGAASIGPPLFSGPSPRRLAFGLAAAALGLAFLSALASPRRGMALDSMRSVAVFALLLPLGASRTVEKAGRWLAGVFLAVTAVNAVVSILEGRDLFHPFPLETFGSRQETGAYAGNVGYLALALALAVVLALGLVLTGRRSSARFVAGLAAVLFAAALLVNRNLTALTAALAGVAVLLVVLYRRRAALPMAAAVLAAAVAVIVYAPLRQRAHELSAAARIGNWDAIVSFRGGAWAAAAEMARERPWLGDGPGTFGAEYVPHRLAAEIRARRRFVAPLMTSSYAEAHCDYLQVFSDAGVPAGLAVVGAVAGLLAAIGRAAWRRRTAEAALLFAVLAAGATGALTWFPFQRPVTAVPLLLAAGRAWRISADDGDTTEEAGA